MVHLSGPASLPVVWQAAMLRIGLAAPS